MLRPDRIFLPHLVLAAALLVSIVVTVSRLSRVPESLPVVAQWLEPDNQFRLALGDVPYDALVRADAVVPADATLLLITSGEDVRRLEYTTFHRALYFLAPRRVWWISPAPSDGTWESRWWRQANLTAGAVNSVVSEQGIHCILTLNVPLPDGVGTRATQWDEVGLWQVAGSSLPCAGPEQHQPATVLDASPSWPLLLVVALGSAVVLGGGLLVIARRLGFRAHPLELVGLAWVLGAGALSVVMLWLNAPGLSPDGQGAAIMVIVTITAVILSIARFRRRREQPGTQEEPAGTVQRADGDRLAGTLRVLLIALLVINALFILFMVVGRPLTVWDSWVNWGMKARIIFREGGITPAVYADPSRAVALLDYPLLVPLLEAWLFQQLGAPDDRLVGLLFWLSYLALPLIIYGAGRRWGASSTLSLLAATAAATLGHVVGLAGSAFTDLFPALFLAIAGIYLIDWLREARPGALFVSAFAAGLLPWAKREGLILLVVLSGALLLTTWLSHVGAGRLRGGMLLWRRSGAAIAAFGLAAGVLAAPWWIFAGREALASAAFLPFEPATFAANLGRMPVIIYLVAEQLIQPEFSAVWLLAPLIGIWLLVGRKSYLVDSALLVLPLVAVLYLGVMAMSYVFSAYVPYQQHALASVFRLGGQVIPLLVIWLAFGIAVPEEQKL